MTKQPQSFRLSEQALQNLQTICQNSGANQTAAVEMALAHFAAQFTKGDEMNAQAIRNAYMANAVNEQAKVNGISVEEVLFEGLTAYDENNQIDQKVTDKARKEAKARYQDGMKVLKKYTLHISHERKIAALIPEHGGVFVDAGHIATTPAYREVWLS